MAVIDARIPLMAQYQPPITVNSLVQLRQLVEQRRTQNALRNIFSTPGALDANGMPTPQAVQRVSQINPAYGMQLAGQIAAVDQKRAATKESALKTRQTIMTAAKAPAEAAYAAKTDALANGASPQQADQAAAEAYSNARQEWLDSGLAAGYENLVPATYNPASVAGVALTPKDAISLREAQARQDQAAENAKATQAYRDAMLGNASARLGIEERTADRLDAEANAANQAAESVGDSAIDYAAARYNMTGIMPSFGMSKGAAALKVKILQRAAQMAQAAGETPDQASVTQMEGKAQQTALSAIDKQQALVSNYERTADKNADLALSASSKVDRSGAPAFNKWILGGRKSLAGDPSVAQFDAANNSFVEEYAKVMSGSSGGGQAATDSARARAHEMLNTAMTPDQYKAVIGILKQEMRNRIDAMNEERESIHAGLSKGSKSSKTLTYDPATGTFK